MKENLNCKCTGTCNCNTNNCNCNQNIQKETEEKILLKYDKNKSNLIQILNEVQEYFGYIPKDSQLAISKYLSIEMAQIYNVITFYSRFSLTPKGKYNVSVCLGTACFVKGAEKILDRVKEKLKIDVGETTVDR